MKGDGNKYLNTLNRIFGPEMGKAMPVVLKVAFGAVGVLFVTALVLIYSDKRFGVGWEHPEAVAYMFQRAAVVLMWLVLAALVVTVIWFVAYMAINSRTQNRKPQPEPQQAIQSIADYKEPKPIDEEKLQPYFKASFKGMGQNINHFPDLIIELQALEGIYEHLSTIDNLAKEVGAISTRLRKIEEQLKKPVNIADPILAQDLTRDTCIYGALAKSMESSREIKEQKLKLNDTISELKQVKSLLEQLKKEQMKYNDGFKFGIVELKNNLLSHMRQIMLMFLLLSVVILIAYGLETYVNN